MIPFRVTFGQKYAREDHPTFAKAHPDGWLTIMAPGYESARQLAYLILGSAWCDLYGPESWAPIESLFPRGELARLSMDDDPDTIVRILAALEAR